MADSEQGLAAHFTPPSESENLTSDSLSAYDCDDEGEENWEDVGSDNSSCEPRGVRGPGVMSLQFQLNAARAGECREL